MPLAVSWAQLVLELGWLSTGLLTTTARNLLLQRPVNTSRAAGAMMTALRISETHPAATGDAQT